MQRRHVLPVLLATPALAQHSGHNANLTPLTPSPNPYANVFQGGAPHHLTPAQEAQRVIDSPAPPAPPGR